MSCSVRQGWVSSAMPGWQETPGAGAAFSGSSAALPCPSEHGGTQTPPPTEPHSGRTCRNVFPSGPGAQSHCPGRAPGHAAQEVLSSTQSSAPECPQWAPSRVFCQKQRMALAEAPRSQHFAVEASSGTSTRDPNAGSPQSGTVTAPWAPPGFCAQLRTSLLPGSHRNISFQLIKGSSC